VKFLLVVIVLAVAVYLTVRLIERRGGRGGSFGAALKRPNRPNRPARPLGPDDDPDFLRDLNRRKRQKDEPGS
jgi:hypothetical protein